MKKQRLRIHFSKTEAMRYTGHLDLRKTWERTFRRAAVPLAYSEGYTPHPQLNLASPLPLGFTSSGEIGDFWLSEIREPSRMHAALDKALPPGLKIHRVESIPDLHGHKLPVLVQASDYLVTVLEPLSDLSGRVEKLLKKEQIIRKRRGKEYDLRDLVHNLEVIPPNPEGHPRLMMTLSTLPGATGRPDEVADQLGIPAHRFRVTRTKIHLKTIS